MNIVSEREESVREVSDKEGLHAECIVMGAGVRSQAACDVTTTRIPRSVAMRFAMTSLGLTERST